MRLATVLDGVVTPKFVGCMVNVSSASGVLEVGVGVLVGKASPLTFVLLLDISCVSL